MNKLADNLSYVETEVGNLRNTVDGVTVSVGDINLRGEPGVEQPRPSVATVVLTLRRKPNQFFLKRFEEFASVFGLLDADMLRRLSISFRNSAYYWWVMNKSTVHTYNEFKEKFTHHFWSKKIQGNLRAQLHSERFVPGKGKKLENHLVEMYVKLRHPEDMSTFREDLLAYDQIDRLQRMQNNSDQDRQSPPDRRPQYTDHTATGSKPPPRYGNNLHVRNVRTAPYSQGGWQNNSCQTRSQGYCNNWRKDGEINEEEEDIMTAILTVNSLEETVPMNMTTKENRPQGTETSPL
ncbi:hypothetical protein PR048_009992 [Dryococelus australis]|uniref:Retrotransposon gag domain-containing protein n=1 Tax=Dryococelus australis TaxID=614101 RepID=A0ABQ9I3C2_9NEOP|nr:hypothetical protein PR048_009992 [Dryococelus australis]